MGAGGSGDVWTFILDSNKQDITGHCINSILNQRMELVGKRNSKDGNFFKVSLLSSDGRTTVIQGEYRCPNIILSLPPSMLNKIVILRRKPPEDLPMFEEYEPQPIPKDDYKAQASEIA